MPTSRICARKMDSQFVWLISLHLALVAGILGAMARGFGWI
jgi:hypothetical protein